jgi:hypothetical protein
MTGINGDEKMAPTNRNQGGFVGWEEEQAPVPPRQRWANAWYKIKALWRETFQDWYNHVAAVVMVTIADLKQTVRDILLWFRDYILGGAVVIVVLICLWIKRLVQYLCQCWADRVAPWVEED